MVIYVSILAVSAISATPVDGQIVSRQENWGSTILVKDWQSANTLAICIDLEGGGCISCFKWIGSADYPKGKEQGQQK